MTTQATIAESKRMVWNAMKENSTAWTQNRLLRAFYEAAMAVEDDE